MDKKGKVVPELKIHELRAETYNGMVRLLKPGCRTIVLIVDRESKEKLVPKFYKFAWPFRRNKTVMFGFLYIEKGDFICQLQACKDESDPQTRILIFSKKGLVNGFFDNFRVF